MLTRPPPPGARAAPGARGARRRGGFTLLEAMGAATAGLVLMLSVFWLQWSGGGASDFAGARDEARARYIAGVMRSFFESELRRAQAEYERFGFLSNMGLVGAELPREPAPGDAFRSAASYPLLRRHAPLAGDNISGGLPVSGYLGGIDYGDPVDTEWYEDNGFLPPGRRVSLDARLVDPTAAEAEVEISSFFGRVRPDALVAGLCSPDEATFFGGGTASEEASCPGSYAAGGGGGSFETASAFAERPLYGYVPAGQIDIAGGGVRCVVDPRHAETPLPNAPGRAADACATTASGGTPALLRRPQLVYPFVGVRRHPNEARDLLVTDETSLALVLRTNFSSDIPEGVLVRAAEMLAPWGGWGLLDSHAAAGELACMPHISALDPDPILPCPSAGADTYNEANKAIVGPHGAWRFLGRELPLKAPQVAGEAAGGRAGPADAPAATVGGQLFMVAILGRRSSPLEIGLAAANAVPAGAGTEISRKWYFPGARGLVRDQGAGVTPGGFGVVYARNLTVTGDLEVGADMIIGGPAYRDEIVVSSDLARGLPLGVNIFSDVAGPGAPGTSGEDPQWTAALPSPAAVDENRATAGAYPVAGGHYERRILDDFGSRQRVAHDEEGAELDNYTGTLRRASGGTRTGPAHSAALHAAARFGLPGYGNHGNGIGARNHLFGHFRPVIGDADGDDRTRLASGASGMRTATVSTGVWDRASGLAEYHDDVAALPYSPLVLRAGGRIVVNGPTSAPLSPTWEGFPDGIPDCQQAPPFCRMGHVVNSRGDVLRSALVLPETELSVEGGNFVSVRGSAYGRDVGRILNERDAPRRINRAPSQVWPIQAGGPYDRGRFIASEGARPGAYAGGHIHTRLRSGLRGTAAGVNVLSSRGNPIEVHAASGSTLQGGRGSAAGASAFGGLEFVPPPLAEQPGRLHARTDDGSARAPMVPVSGRRGLRADGAPPGVQLGRHRHFFDLGALHPDEDRYDLYGPGCSLPPIAPRLAPALANRLADPDRSDGTAVDLFADTFSPPTAVAATASSTAVASDGVQCGPAPPPPSP